MRDGRIERVADLMRGRSTLVLSGAGISTESGIPDYRGPAAAGRSRSPITYQDFVGSQRKRQRYWARSFVGWPFMDGREPNGGHFAVAAMESSGKVSGVVTQNVDGLHLEAGSKTLVELHGNLRNVVCLRCASVEDRRSLQLRLAELNPDFSPLAPEYAPDGDSDVPDELVDSFVVAPCQVCGGVLKPEVVFFGENVPAQTYQRAKGMLEDAEALLVVGSSLTVRSGYRFVVQAKAAEKPVAIVNDGPTRGDDEADVKVSGRLGETLPRLAELLI